MIRIESDWNAVEEDIDRIMSMPSAGMVLGLDSVQAVAFALTMADVHVDTGSLKSSLTSKTGLSETRHWEGELHAGGPSGGVNNPVDYAIYEKRRGGPHDFFGGLEALDPAYIGAIEKGLLT